MLETVNNGKVKVALLTGHYPDKPGQFNEKAHLIEHIVCDQITRKTFELLNKDERYSKYVKCTHIFSDTLHKKKERIVALKPDIIIENHMNWSFFKKRTGIMTIFEGDNLESRFLAYKVNKMLVLNLHRKDLGIFTHDIVKRWRNWKSFFIFDRIEYKTELLGGLDVPTILTEIDYISNAEVAEQVKEGIFIANAAAGLAMGINIYCQQVLWENEMVAKNLLKRRDSNA